MAEGQEASAGVMGMFIFYTAGRVPCACGRAKAHQSGPFKCVCCTVYRLPLRKAIRDNFSTGETISYLSVDF